MTNWGFDVARNLGEKVIIRGPNGLSWGAADARLAVAGCRQK